MASEVRTKVMIDAAVIRLERRAAVTAVAVALGLTVTKVVAWRVTGSNAVFSDALEGLVNVVSSIVSLWAIRQSHRPADRSHPYGHGRFELLSAALEGGMIAIAAVVILWRAGEALLVGDVRLSALDTGIGLLLLTVIVNGAVGCWLASLGRRHGSPALAADGRHLLSDAITTAGAIAALVIVRLTDLAWLDPAVAIAFGIGIGVMGVRVVRRSLGDLVDEQDPRDAAKLESILSSHCGPEGREPRICSWHKLRVRHVGREHWVDFHLCVPRTMDVGRAHDVASAIEHEMELDFGPGDATAHVEPCPGDGCGVCGNGSARITESGTAREETPP